MYMMGCYHLYEGAQQELILLGGRFFWQGVGNKKKYHMVKWEHLARPKKFGGLGFLDTRVMNKVLLIKWLVRLDSGENNICLNLLRKKYMGGKSVAQQEVKCGASQFWQGIMGYERGLGWKCENGRQVRLWDDVWLTEYPLRLCYPKIYSICENKKTRLQKPMTEAGNLTSGGVCQRMIS
ncbi:hypothetical protein U9M48_029032 [Paspalum notatum var. saurae]|uniref:Uncharacterized protein n=1 Tax=Paspalum notatum var. saurae TaxID=547442 RepID=A0AAQ3U278_PASNO